MKKKIIAILTGSLVLLVIMAGNSIANGNTNGYEDSSPNSGDGVPDGSGYDPPNGPNSDGSGSGHNSPAPNSGDGVPDGSGWE
jgi:hypothetical protein